MNDPRRLLDSKLTSAPLLRQYLDVTSNAAVARPGPARRPRFGVMGGLAAAFVGVWLVIAADKKVRPADASRDQTSMIPGGPSGSEGSSGSGVRTGTGGTSGGTG